MFKGLVSSAFIGVKRMGELDSKPFHEAVKRKYDEEEAGYKALELCSVWDEYLRDPNWHPFKVITVEGKSKVCFLLILSSLVLFFLLLGWLGSVYKLYLFVRQARKENYINLCTGTKIVLHECRNQCRMHAFGIVPANN